MEPPTTCVPNILRADILQLLYLLLGKPNNMQIKSKMLLLNCAIDQFPLMRDCIGITGLVTLQGEFQTLLGYLRNN